MGDAILSNFQMLSITKSILMTCFSINVMLNYLWTNNMSDNGPLKYNFAKTMTTLIFARLI